MHVLSDSLLEDHLKCSSKSYLHLQGRSGRATDYSVLCSQLDASYRAGAAHWLAAQSTDRVSRFGGARLQSLTSSDAIFLDAVGEADGLETHFDGLQRISSGSRLGTYQYRPIRFCRQVQPNLAA